MCGIVAYTGLREAQPILLEILSHLEYRGYDSAGLATLSGSCIHVRKRAGRLAALAAMLQEQPAPGCQGIGHTRWATHGGATDHNAHPHLDGGGVFAVVHNGVINNYQILKQQLQSEGFVFQSDTDTEVLAHLIARHFQGDLVKAVWRTLDCVRGTYGLAVLSSQYPGLLIAARLGSPLTLGIGQSEVFLASDPTVLAGYAEKVVHLDDHQVAVLQPNSWQIINRDRTTVAACMHSLNGVPYTSHKDNFPHYMLKEIYEQPEVIENALRGRLDDAGGNAHLDGLNLALERRRDVRRLILTGCGTSYHAALVGEYLIETMARVPVEVEYASEFRYRCAPLDDCPLVIALSQSGETADTLAAVCECQRRRHPTLGVCNVVGSTLAREVDSVIYLHAGPEIGVASTKAFTAQVVVLTLLAFFLGRLRNLSRLQGERTIEELRSLPDWIRQTLGCQVSVRQVAEKYAHVRNLLYLGRHYLYPIALEGALKLQEVSYIHAQGYPAAEMKHGPIALVDGQTPVLVLATRGPLFDKVMSNLEEVKARGAPVIAVACAGDKEVAARADEVIYVPVVPDYLQPLVTVVPLQLLAYSMAVLRGCDVDRPRNLAKCVTVE